MEESYTLHSSGAQGLTLSRFYRHIAPLERRYPLGRRDFCVFMVNSKNKQTLSRPVFGRRCFQSRQVGADAVRLQTARTGVIARIFPSMEVTTARWLLCCLSALLYTYRPSGALLIEHLTCPAGIGG